jgi:alpha-amylase/alpha-mannosidase (GH57 family)
LDRFICIHGHFYQPPRENPWLDQVEVQDSAYPYHDWNERVTAECYARNAAARILDGNRRIVDIVNNYSKISFDFGPTLLSWMQEKDPEIYAAVLEADRLSQQYFSGHGSAIAQVYNHMIMPLATYQDKRTQIIWGIKDFESRFKRKPEGMWLAETAVDLESLDIMAQEGIKFTVLAPHQAKRIKQGGQEMLWQDVSAAKVDPRVPYRCYLPSGRQICIFFYDGPIALGVAFEGLLNNGEHFARRLSDDFTNGNSHPQVVNIATDGETYGHHHKFGDMALAYCLQYIESSHLARLTVYGEFLQRFPPTQEVEIVENSSWSCVHGIERWRSDCGCSTGGQPGWNQKWRAPLRQSLDWLRDQIRPLYEKQMSGFTNDPWGARDRYIEVILDRSEENMARFLLNLAGRPLKEEEKIKILKLLEMQTNAMLMYTSCGWFFNEVSGIETVQILKYAARAIQLAQDVASVGLEEGFISRLAGVASNVPELKDGAQIYRTMVKPSVVDLLRVGAHYAMTSLFEQYAASTNMYSYTVKSDQYDLKEAGRLRLVVGRAMVRSKDTWEQADICFTVLHLGDHNFIGGVDYLNPGEFSKMRTHIMNAFLESDIPSVIGFIKDYFKYHSYSLWHLFKEEQRKILNQVLQSTMDDIETSFRQIYDHHYPLMQIKNEISLPLPRMLMTVVEFVLNRDISVVLEAEDVDIKHFKQLIEEMKRWSFKRDQANFSFLASQRISALMKRLSENPDNIHLMEKIIIILELLAQLSLDLDLWRAQNIYFAMGRKIYPDILSQAGTDELSGRWVKFFGHLGEILKVNITSPLLVGKP